MTNIAIQMWTVRREAERSLQMTLESLGEMGYRAVETVGFHGMKPRALREMLKEAGLEVSSAHVPLPAKSTATGVFEELAELGAPAVFPSLRAESFADAGAIARAADAFNDIVPVASDHGIELGYHNHWWEFARGPDGTRGYEKFLELLDPKVTMEVDTYWAQVGGVDAADLVRALGERVHFLHIKDGPVDLGPDNQSAVGEGNMDIPRVLGANPAVRWHVVELDGCAGDIWEKVRTSLKYLANHDPRS